MVFEIGTLADYIKVQGGFAYKSQDFQNSGTNKVLKIKNVRFGTVDYSDTVFISDKLAQDTLAWSTNEGDLLISMTGSGPNAPQSLVGRVARVWAGEDTAWINQRVGRIVVKEQGLIHPDFIFYLLRQQSSQDFLVANSSGSANQANISGKTIEMLPCPLVSYEESSRIASILLSLDKKITLNRQINQTLEQIAQELFKSWFVDFDPVVDNALDAGFFEQHSDLPEALLRRAEQRKIVREQPDFNPLPAETRQLFPTAFEECEEPSLGLGGWVPKGWRVQSCDDVSEKIGMGPFGSNIKVSTFVESGVPVISGAHLKGVLLEDGAYNFITEEHALKLNNSCVYRGDVIFTHAGSIGQVSIIPEGSRYDKYIISQRQFYLRPDREKVVGNYIVYFFHSVAGQHKLLSNASQTGVPSIARPSTHLKNIRLVVPSVEVQHVFDFNIRGWNEKIMKSRENIFSLTKLRDTLLPKLISGELRLSDDGTLASGNTDC